MSFQESLSIEILADSSQFQGELDGLIRRLEQVNRSVESLGQAGSRIGRLGNSFTRVMQPLSRLSNYLVRVGNHIQRLSGTSVTINVSPAMAALNRLSAMIARVAAQLASLGGGGGGYPLPAQSSGGSGGGFTSGGDSQQGTGRRFAAGGLVTGAPGIDRIPAYLTAGEYVLQKEVVRELGSGRLDELNRSGLRSSVKSNDVESSSVQTIHQYGEISIHVSESIDVGQVLKDLEVEGHRLRNRRG